MNTIIHMLKVRDIALVLGVMTLFCGCKTTDSKVEEPVEKEVSMPEESGEQEPTEVIIEELTLIDQVERVPPEQRTFKDDMVIVCYSPSRVDVQTQGDERVQQITTYISNNIYTPEAMQFFQDMSVMEVSSRDDFFEQQINKLGLTSCPYLEESRQEKAVSIEQEVELDTSTPKLDTSDVK
jgi:hypothetical protein